MADVVQLGHSWLGRLRRVHGMSGLPGSKRLPTRQEGPPHLPRSTTTAYEGGLMIVESLPPDGSVRVAPPRDRWGRYRHVLGAIAIFAVAACWRLAGIGAGLPLVHNRDEDYLVDISLALSWED